MQSTEVCFLPQFTQAKYPYYNPDASEEYQYDINFPSHIHSHRLRRASNGD